MTGFFFFNYNTILTRNRRLDANTWEVILNGLMASKHTDWICCLPVAITDINLSTSSVLTELATHIMGIQFTNSKEKK